MNIKKDINKNLLFALPSAIILCLLPLVVYAKVINYNTGMLSLYKTTSIYSVDIFNHYKALLLIATAAVMVILSLIYKTRALSPLNNKATIPAYTYMILVILATIFSTSTYYSFKGYINHTENIWVLVAYIIVFIYTALFFTNEDQLIFLTKLWILSIFLLTAIGLTQFLGNDFYRTDFGLSLIIPPSLRDQVSNVEFTLWSDNLIYQSLFHYNYVSFYSATAFPFFLALFIGTKAMKERLLYIGVMAVLIFNLFGSQGRNGLIGVAVGSILVVVFFGRKVLLHKATIISVIAVLAALITLTLTTDTVLERRTIQAFTELNTPIDYPLNSIVTKDNEVVIDHDAFVLKIFGDKKEDGNIVYELRDGTDQVLKVDRDGSAISIMNTTQNGYDFSGLNFTLMNYEDESVLCLELQGIQWYFIYKKDGFYVLNAYGNLVKMADVEAIGFEGLERWGSKRGYIWSRTLPLVLEKPLLGYGPDTYALAFPQDDYVGKLNAYDNPYMFVDKPHNIYMNYAVNTGLLSLLAILAILATAFVKTIRQTKSSRGYKKLYSIASIGSIAGYMTAGFFNDTSLHITPIFWVLVGINYAVNRDRDL